jgi:hypothetical protein
VADHIVDPFFPYEADLMTARDVLLVLPQFSALFTRERQREQIWLLKTIVLYEFVHPGRRKKAKVTETELEQLAAGWVEMMAGLITAHTREEYERHDYKTTDMFTPILSIPVAQLRIFARHLVLRLEADPRIPYNVWTAYKALIEAQVVNAQDAEVIELKTALARQIAEMVEMEVQPQLLDALTNALKWRDPEKLEKIAAVVAKPDRPPAKLTGRESCLFLEVGGEQVML